MLKWPPPASRVMRVGRLRKLDRELCGDRTPTAAITEHSVSSCPSSFRRPCVKGFLVTSSPCSLPGSFGCFTPSCTGVLLFLTSMVTSGACACACAQERGSDRYLEPAVSLHGLRISATSKACCFWICMLFVWCRHLGVLMSCTASFSCSLRCLAQSCLTSR
jgi:hypothetical protein